MDRNLDRRVEALVKVTDPNARARLDQVLQLAWRDDVRCWDLAPDRTWQRAGGGSLVDVQLVHAARRPAAAAIGEDG